MLLHRLSYVLFTFFLLSSVIFQHTSPYFCCHLFRSHILHLTACQQFAHLNRIPSLFFLTFTRSHPVHPHSYFLFAFLLLCGDIELNPGPNHFTLCTLNIRSILHPLHSAAISGFIDSHHPDLFSLTETWIKPTTTSTELAHITPPNYTFLSFPRNCKNNTSSAITGGGIGFLIREPFVQLPSSLPQFSSFESSSVTLKLPHSKLSVFNIYRPPLSSPFSKPYSVFLEEFNSFLSFAATTPHEFIITGDFNIHIDNSTDHLSSQFLSLLSSFNLMQHVNFPTHNKNHILDLIITSSDSSLAPSLSTTYCSPSDHFPIFSKLSIARTPPLPPSLHSFRRFHSIDIDSFVSDIQSSRLITNPPKSLGSLLICYNITLSSLLDKHAPIISKLSKRTSASNPWFTPTLRAFRSAVRRAENL